MYEPECNDKMQPKIGMLFDSWEAGVKFYTEYAHEVGFSVRTGTQHLGKSGEALWKRFVWRKQKHLGNNDFLLHKESYAYHHGFYLQTSYFEQDPWILHGEIFKTV